MMYSGYLSEIFLLPYFVFYLRLDLMTMHLLLYIFLVPTIISAYTSPPRRIRDITRFLLGIAIIHAFTIVILAFIQGVYLLGLYIIGLYISLRLILTKKRGNSNRRVCEGCDHYDNPRCDGVKDYFLHQKGVRFELDVLSE
ncbi:MAG: hypothetical protein ACW98K_00910 [Candidatus Kariarchaeaceae archaeon]